MVRYLRVLGFLEGSSLLLLLGVAMPVKYVLGEPELVKALGMLHGVLFLAFSFTLFSVGATLGWSYRMRFLGFVMAIVPLGTFWFDRNWLQPLVTQDRERP